MTTVTNEDDLTLGGVVYLPGHDATHDAILLDHALDLGGDWVTLRRLGSPSDLPLGGVTVSRLGGGGLRVTGLVLAQRGHALAGLPYLSVGVSLGHGEGVAPAVAWVSVTDRPTFPGQPPYRLTRVADPQGWQGLLRGAYQAVHVPHDPGESGDYHVEWWHRDDPGLAGQGASAVG